MEVLLSQEILLRLKHGGRIEVFEGNLTEQRVDAIVNIIGEDMDLSRGGVLSKAVARAVGERVVRQSCWRARGTRVQGFWTPTMWIGCDD